VKRAKSKLTALFYVRDQVLRNVNCTGEEAAVLLALASYANPDGSNVWPGEVNLASLLRLSKRTIQRALQAWEELNIIKCLRRGCGAGHASVYRIVLPKKKVSHASPFIGTTKGVTRAAVLREKRCHAEREKGVTRVTPPSLRKPTQSEEAPAVVAKNAKHHRPSPNAPTADDDNYRALPLRNEGQTSSEQAAIERYSVHVDQFRQKVLPKFRD
jgi:hypothetical protein